MKRNVFTYPSRAYIQRILINMLDDDNMAVRMEAGMALSQIGEPAVKQLTQALNHEKRRVRKAAKKAFKEIKLYQLKAG